VVIRYLVSDISRTSEKYNRSSATLPVDISTLALLFDADDDDAFFAVTGFYSSLLIVKQHILSIITMGVIKETLVAGDGKTFPKKGDNLTMHYQYVLSDLSVRYRFPGGVAGLCALSCSSDHGPSCRASVDNMSYSSIFVFLT
jgi:hypothetical protein